MESAAGPRRPNARGQGDQLRGEIVGAALAMLGEMGDDEAMSLRAVARRLGVSPTSIYLYFSDRDALVLAAMEHCHEQVVAVVAAAEEQDDRPAAQLRARIIAQADWAARNPGLVKVMHESRVSQRPGMPFKETLLASMTASVQRCIDAGAAPPADALTVALDLRAAVIGAVSLRINEPNLPWPPLEAQIDRFLAGLAGIKPSGNPTPGA